MQFIDELLLNSTHKCVKAQEASKNNYRKKAKHFYDRSIVYFKEDTISLRYFFKNSVRDRELVLHNYTTKKSGSLI